jgi:peptidoglycan/LPS O-acetylase OafA/YrhL
VISSNTRMIWFALLFFAGYIFISYLVEIYFGFKLDAAGQAYEARTFAEKVFAKITGDRGLDLLVYFLCGSLFYNLRYHIPWSIFIALGSAIVIFLANEKSIIEGPIKHVIQVCEVSYIAIFIGVANIPRMPIFKNGDYSYGIYLYGYVIQQTIVQMAGGRMTIVLNFLIAAILSTVVAIFSWHSVEKPILSLRKKFSFTARKTEAAEREWEEMSARAAISHAKKKLDTAEFGGELLGD